VGLPLTVALLLATDPSGGAKGTEKVPAEVATVGGRAEFEPVKPPMRGEASRPEGRGASPRTSAGGKSKPKGMGEESGEDNLLLGGADLWRVILLPLSLALFLGIFMVVLRALRSRLGRGSGAIEVLGNLALGPGRGICLLRVGRRILVVGLSPQWMGKIAELEGEEAEELLEGLGPRGKFERGLRGAGVLAEARSVRGRIEQVLRSIEGGSG